VIYRYGGDVVLNGAQDEHVGVGRGVDGEDGLKGDHWVASLARRTREFVAADSYDYVRTCGQTAHANTP
jgi:hypothetical protein